MENEVPIHFANLGLKDLIHNTNIIYKDPANEGIYHGERDVFGAIWWRHGLLESFVGFSEVESPKDADGDSDMSEDPLCSLANQRNVQMCSTFVGFESLPFLEDLDFSAGSASKSESVFYFLPTVDNQDIQQRSA